MKKEKLEQLREIFKKEIKEMVYLSSCYTDKTFEELIEKKANQLVYEVKIRIDNN